MHEAITCLNGEFMPASRACLPVASRAVRFGDGLFATLRVTRGVPYQWEWQLTRLERGLAALRIPAPDIDWRQAAIALLDKNHVTDGFLRIFVSRGGGSSGYLPLDTAAPADWGMEFLPARPLPDAPLALWHSACTRPALAALPANHKLSHGISSTLALLEAQENGCDEALLMSASGHIASAAAANIFWLKGDRLYTPSLTTGCLEGSTRHALLRLSPTPVEEGEASLGDLLAADACFLTNSRYGIAPVATLLPQATQWADSHPLIRQLAQILADDIDHYTNVNSDSWKYYP